MGGTFTVDGSGTGTDKFTDPAGGQTLANGETVTYSWTGNTKGAYLYIAYTQNNASNFAAASVLDTTATSGSGSFTFSNIGAGGGDYFQVGLQQADYFNSSTPKPSARNSSVQITLSCGAATPTLSVDLAHSGNAIQSGTKAYSVTPTISAAPTTTATLTATITLPTGMSFSSQPSGTGWACGSSGNPRSCTRNTALAVGTRTAEAISFNATFTSTASSPLVPSVTLSGGGAGSSASDTDSTVVDPFVIPTITAAFNSPTVQLGGSRLLTVTITNSNVATTLTGVGFNAGALPGTLNGSNPASTCTGATASYNSGTKQFSLSGGTLAANASCNATLTVTPNAASDSTYTTGTVFATGPSVTGSTATTGTLSGIGAPTIAAAFSPVSVAAGATSTLTLTLTNPNPSRTVTGVAVAASQLPANLNGTNPATTCSGTVSFAGGSLSLAGGSLTAGASCTVTMTVSSNTANTYSYTTGAPSATGPVSTNGIAATTALTVTAAAPTVTALSPIEGPSSGTNTVAITGTNLTGVTAVNFGGTPATDITSYSDTSITATAPAHAAGTVNVTVTTPGGTSATNGNNQFTYVATPIVTARAPTSGPVAGGTSVTITGSNFSGATAVTFGATPATNFLVNSATQITAVSPAGTGTVDIRVTSVGGTSATSTNDQFTYIAAPTVSGRSPTSGPAAGGTVVTITGTNLLNATAVTFGATPATAFTVNSATQVTATAPAGTGTVDIRVTTAGGTSATSANDQFTYIAAPTVSGRSPTSGPTGGGTVVTITGTNLLNATAVTFGATPATAFTVNSASQVTATAPAGTGTVDIRVTTGGGTSATSANDQFTYIAAPTVSGRSPTSGPAAGGTTVTIAGSNFSGATAVTFGATPATSYFVSSATLISAVSPAGTGTVDIRVTTGGGTSATNASDQFTYIAAPTVGAISPTSGPAAGGTVVTITGTNLLNATAVTFGATPATAFTVNSAIEITAMAPAGTGTVDVRVTTGGGTSATSAADQFSYIATPTVTGLNPTVGTSAGGTTVTLTGTGFTNTATVSFGGTPAASSTFVSATQITAVTPARAAGTVNVTVTTTGGTSATSAGNQFTFSVPPTTPAIFAPANGSTVGTATPTYSGASDANATITVYIDGVSIGTTAANGGGTWTKVQPTALAAGSHTVYATATNFQSLVSGNSATNNFTVTPAPVAGSFTHGSVVAYNDGGNQPYSFNLSSQVTGSPTSYAVGSATTNQGGTVSIDNSGQVSFTPPAGYRGNDSFTYTASNAGGTSAPGTVTILVGNPTLSISLVGSGVRGTPLAGVQLVTGGGAAPYSCGTTLASGALPAGTQLNADCTLSGTPAASGTFNFAATVTDSSTGTGPFSQTSGQLTLTVAAPTLTLSPAAGALPGATAGAAHSQTFTASGGSSSFTYAVTAGAVPTGLTLSAGGALSGTPTAAGTFTFTVTATDSSTAGSGGPYTVANSYSLTVAAQAPVAGPASATVVANSSNNPVTLALSGGAATSVAISTAPAQGTATVSGTTISYTPAASYYGADSFTYTASGPGGTSAPATVTITVTSAPVITAQPADQSVTAGQSASFTAAAGGNPNPTVQWQVSSNGGASFTNIGGATGTTLTFAPVAGQNGYKYRAVFNNSQGSATTSAATLTVNTIPSVTGVTPNNGTAAGGTTITIAGSGFNGTTGVTVGGNPASNVTVVSNAQITATTPAGTFGAASVVVTNGVGTSSTNGTFTYTAAPIVTSVTPNKDRTGSTPAVTIVGTNFTPGSAVSAGGSNALSVTYVSPTQLNATLHALPAGTYNVRVVTAYGTSPADGGNQFLFIDPPSQVTLTPLSGPTSGGNTVTLSGASLANGTSVTFGGVAGTIVSSAALSAVVTPPAGTAGTVSVVYSTPYGSTTALSSYTYVAAPTADAQNVTTAFNTANPVTLTASGSPTSYTVTTPPAHGTLSGTAPNLTYTPAAGYVGTDSFDFTATNVGGTSAPATIGITVSGPTIAISPATLPGGAVGAAYTPSVTASGGTSPYTYAVTAGALPTGVTLGSGGGFAGTPTAGGTFTFTVTATDSTTGAGAPYSGSRAYSVTFAAPTITLSPATLPNATAGTAYTQAITASGGTAGYSYAITAGALPAGITLTGGSLSGTPTAAGTFNFTITATDSSTGAGPYTGARAYSLTVAAPTIAISPATLPVATAGAAYSQAITASGGTAGYSYSVTAGALPAGVTLAGNTLSGTPTAGGTFTFTIAATDSSTGAGAPFTGSRTYSLSVNSPTLALAPATLPAGQMAVAYSQSLSVSGGTAPYSYAITAGALPAGVSLGTTGTLSGTPSVNGTFTFTATATDSSTGAGPFSASRAYSLVIAPPAVPVAGDVSAAVAYNSVANPVTLMLSGGSATSVAIGTAPAHGTAVATGVSITYTPTAGYYGADSFTYTATNDGGTSNVATVSLTVATPAAPVAADRSGVAVAYNSAGAAIDLSASITGVRSSIAVGTAPAHGITSIAGDVVTYTPTAGYYGADSFTYTATGPGGTSAPATVSLTVATPAAPVAADRSGVAVAYNSAGTSIDLSASITGVHSSIAIGTAPAHGTTSIAGDVVTYTPTTGYYGADSFTYTATGPGGTSAPATVSVTVATPAAPVAADRSGVAVAYNSAGTAIDLSASIIGVHSSIAIGTAPAHGTTSIAGDVVTYTPTAGYFGADSFTYTATGPGGTSNVATVSLTVATPAAPIAANKSGVAVGYNSAGTAIDLSSSVTGVRTSIAIGTQPAHGTTSITGDVVTYTPATGYYGTDSFTYTATGPGGTSNVATVSLTVATPAAPVAADRSGVAVAYNSAGTAIDLSASINGVHSSIAVGTAPTHGTTSIAGDVVTYSPTAGYYGADSFTYTATGPGGTSNVATVSLTVATPAAPVAADRSGVAIAYNSSGTAIDLSASITGVHSAIAVGTAPTHGTTTIAGDVVTYTPAAGYYGSDSFSYTATGPGGTSNVATVSLTVATPAAPVAANKSGVAVAYNSTGAPIDLSGSITGVHSLVQIAAQPTHGTVSIAADVVTYTPPAGYYGADSFTYTASGPGGTSNVATVSLTVATPAAPVAANKSGVAVSYNSAGTAIDLSSSISGVHSGMAIGTAPAHGTTSIAGDVVTYTPTAGYHGADSFTYTATGPGGTSNVATVSLTVATPAAPVAADRSGVAVAYNSAGTAIDLSASITGVHSSIAVGTAPAHGTTTIAGDVVTYTPTVGYYGADSFTYTATGPGGTSNAATVSLTVATPAAPVAANKSGVAVAYNSAGTAIDLSGSISGVHASIAIGTAPAHGTTSIAGDVVTYTPATGYYGADSFTYTATGPGGPSNVATVSLTVATPAAPVAADRSGVAVTYNSAGTTIDLSGSITGVHTSIALGTAPAHGTTTISGDVVTYTPAAGYFGADSFTYTATGPGGVSNVATVSLTVATPAAPVAADKSGVAIGYNSTGTAIDLSTSITGVRTGIAIGTAPAHGTITVAGEVVTYTPTASYFGADSFAYTATGPGGVSNIATVSLTVATPAAPVTANKTVAVPYNSTGTAIDLAPSITGVRTGIAIGTASAHGTVTISGEVVTYVPAAGYFGSDSFTFTATGPGGVSNVATVSLTVATPAAPVAANKIGVAVTYNSAGTAIDLTASINGVHTLIQIGTAPAHGTVTSAGDVVTYKPATGYYGADSFTYTATGPGGTSNLATVSLTVANPPPPAAAPGTGTVAGSSSINANTSVEIDLSALVTGEYDSIVIETQPAHGTVTLRVVGGQSATRQSAGGTQGALAIGRTIATYRPAAGFVGTETFTFAAVGPGGRSAAAAISVTVIGSVPVASPQAASTGDGQTVSVELTNGASEGPFTGAAVVTLTPANSATTRIVDSGTGATRTFRLEVTPNARYSGNVVVGYTLTNAYGSSAPALVTVAVTARPNPTADSNVRGISDAQAETARRFARGQVANFMRRSEQLHGGGGSSQMGTTLNSRDGRGLVRRSPAFDASALEITERMRPSANDPMLGQVANMRDRGGLRADLLGTGAMGVTSTTGTGSPRRNGTVAGALERPVLSADSEDQASGERQKGSVAIWSGGAIDIGTQDATTRRAKITATTAGLSAGADIKLADGVVVGLGGGYGNDVSHIGGTAARVRSTSSLFAAYASVSPGSSAFIDGMIGIGDLSFSTRRAVATLGVNALGSRDGRFTVGAIAAGIDRQGESLRWSLYGRGEFMNADLSAYTETGAGRMNLRFDARDVRSLTGTLGARIEFTGDAGFATVTPRLRGEWNHEFSKTDAQLLDYADIPGVSLFSLDTQGWSRDQFQLSAGARFAFPRRWSFDVEGGLRAGTGEKAATLRVQLSKEF